MSKVFVVNVSICNGCHNCQIACKDEHVGNDWSPYAKPQPDTGQFWLKLNEHIRGTIPKVKIAYVPTLCMHCDDAPCKKSCPIPDAIYKRDDGLVIIDPIKCTGCRNCVDTCPYGVIYFNDDLNIAQKCTGCAHLLDNGFKIPRCIDVCPTDAIMFGEEKDLRNEISKAEILHQEYGTKPRVYYIGLPKRFVAGAVYDPEEDECIEDATVTLTDLQTAEKFITKTDRFGDFWFEDMKTAKYSLEINCDGYQTWSNEMISTENDVNIGDIELLTKR